MGFSEITFLFVFLPLSIVLYLLVDKVFRNDTADNVLIVVLSIIFYWWANKETVSVFMFVAAFTYMAGKVLGNEKKKANVFFPVVCLIGILLFYKYAKLVGEWINEVTKKPYTDVSKIIIPLGISFIVFEAVSYVVDIYRGDAEPGSFLECLTFLSLFPKLVSGPIVLWKDFKPQLKNRRTKLDEIAEGVDRIIIGLAKKAIIADTFGARIAAINIGISVGGVDTPTLWLRAFLYFFQLYFDFAGYSDIAIGLGRIFGFQFKENFDYPYLSSSISEFWRRWHISLGIWFREYVYIPLGGNRRGNVYIHLLIVFLLTGIWHGAGWQFLVWGAIHGLCVVVERLIHDRTWYKKTPMVVKWFFTMFVVGFAWIFFMSKDLKTSWETISAMFASTSGLVNFTWRYYLSNRAILFFVLIAIGHLLGLKLIKKNMRKLLNRGCGVLARRVFLLLLFAVDLMYVVSSTYSPFLYFQF